MADIADMADKQNETMLVASIANARTNMVGNKGPVDCVKCGDWNDRQHAGYTTCTDCYEKTLAELQ